jgi:porin
MLEAGPSGPRRVHGNAGLYGLVEGLLYSPDPRNRAGLRGWLRAGLADDRINAVDYYAGGGLVYNGPFRREADQIGIAVAYAHFGEPGRRAALVAGQSLGTGETNIELTYSLAVADLVTIQPDLQYVISPGADRDIPDALVVGTRIVLAWP